MKPTSLPKKGKPVKAWAIKRPDGELISWTATDLSTTTRGLFLDSENDLMDAWPKWRRLGYSCVRVSITELPPERKRRKS